MCRCFSVVSPHGELKLFHVSVVLPGAEAMLLVKQLFATVLFKGGTG